MMPNMDPRAMKGMLAKMGIKTTELDATRVVIETPSSEIVIENPQVTKIEAQGSVSFQIGGDVSEKEKSVSVEITEDDIKMVMENTGVTDREKVVQALTESKGDIAAAILLLKGDQDQA